MNNKSKQKKVKMEERLQKYGKVKNVKSIRNGEIDKRKKNRQK